MATPVTVGPAGRYITASPGGAVSVDYSQIPGFAQALRLMPQQLAKELATAFQQIGAVDTLTMRAQVASGFKGRKGFDRAFTFRSTDPGKATGIGKLFISEYTRFAAFKGFETGATISGKSAASIPILVNEKYRAQLRGTPEGKFGRKFQMLVNKTDGRVYMTRIRGDLYVMRDYGGLTKTGKTRKGSRTEIIAIFRESAKLKKRISFFQNFQNNASRHDAMLDAAVERALQNTVHVTTDKAAVLSRALSTIVPAA